MIKVLLLDVDGTLLSFETHKVSQSSIDALKKVHDSGIKIVIATGRAAQAVRKTKRQGFAATDALRADVPC